MKRLIKSEITDKEYIECMSNIRGSRIKVPGPQEFSFYFSNAKGQHNICVKPVFNNNRLSRESVGTLKLCDDWRYTPGQDDKHVSKQQVDKMKQFFRTYLVLFCAAWDLQIQEDDVQDYFKGLLPFEELMQCFDFYSEEMDSIQTIEELELYCKKNNLVDFRDN